MVWLVGASDGGRSDLRVVKENEEAVLAGRVELNAREVLQIDSWSELRVILRDNIGN